MAQTHEEAQHEQPRTKLVAHAVDSAQRNCRRSSGDPAHDAREKVRREDMDDDEKADSGLLTED